MRSKLAPVLSTADFAEAELAALRLDGEVYRLDDCAVPIDEVPSVLLRGASLATVFPASLIAERRSAAWVWGALDNPPTRHEACTGMDKRTRPPGAQRFVLREVVIGVGDTVSLAGMTLTTPIRTAIDLARTGGTFDRDDEVMLGRLLAIGGFTAADCQARMSRRRNLPNRALAGLRLERSENRALGLLGLRTDPVHVVDGVDSAHGVEHPIHVGRVTHLEHETADREAVA